jgi:hypothetical protein
MQVVGSCPGLAIDTLGWEVPGPVRKAVITDPDGNTIALGEVSDEKR